jgi:signal transduction histidine kinase
MQRVEDPSRTVRPLVDVRRDVVRRTSAARPSSSVTDECRRLAELLRLDSVGVATGIPDDRRVSSWSAPDAAPLPARLDDVLEGKVGGWIVCPLPGDAAVFARATADTSPRATAVLQAVGPSLAAGASEDRGDGASHAPLSLGENPEQISVRPREGRPIEDALAELCTAMGFDTASLFVRRTGHGWSLAARVGPERPWHSVIDAAAAGPIGTGVVYADARALPGVGSRLAGLGCGGIAVLPVPGGARVVLDADTVRRGTPSVEHADPYLALIAPFAGELQESEMPAVLRVATAIRRVLETGGAEVSDLLEATRGALRADEVFHLVERADDVTVARAPAAGWPRRIPREIRASLRTLPSYGPLDDASARQLGLVLGATSSHLAAAFAPEGGPQEAVVAGWREGPGLSSETMRVAAQMVGAARSVIDSNRHAIEARMLKERNRWAYEIHDGLTQAVTTAVLELEALGRQIENDPHEALKILAATRVEIRKSLSELRGILYDLSQDEKAGLELDEPLTKYVNDVVKRWRLPARVSITGDLQLVPKNLLGVAYVVIREALANAAKHAAAGSVTVAINATPTELKVEVGDTGRGFTGAGPGVGTGKSFGLDMIKKRVADVGGTVSVESSPGKGTRVVAHLPVGEGER